MNLELLTIGLHVGKYFIATTLLVLIYLLLYRGKASFNQSRIFLLTLPFLALLLSQWNITVYTPPTKFVEIVAPLNTVNDAVADNTFQYTQKANTAIVSPTVTETKMQNISQLLNAETVLIISVLIALLLLLPAIWQCVQLLKIVKSGKISVYKGFDVVTSSAIPTPFSFYKTIFVNESLKAKKQEIILKHESWHIKHRHYIDVFIIEFTTRLFWFNPLLWWVRKELRSVCEFQTDKSVLEDGQEIYTYQTLILEEVMGQSSFLANGFNNSFTKKRFITMKSNPNVRLNSLRRILLPFCMLLIFASLSFSIGKQKTEYIVKEVSQNNEEKNVNNANTHKDSLLAITSINIQIKSDKIINDSVAGNQKLFSKEMENEMNGAIQEMTKGLGEAFGQLGKLMTVEHIDTILKLNGQTTFSKPVSTAKPTKEELDKERNSKLWRAAYKATDVQAKACDVPFSEKARIDRIENDLTSNETKILLFVPIYSDNFWLRFDKGFEITDLETHDKYLIRRLEEGLPLNKSIIIKNKSHKMVAITLVFPLIRPKAKRIDVFENIADYSEIMSNDAGQIIFRNINVPDYLVTKSKSGKIYK